MRARAILILIASLLVIGVMDACNGAPTTAASTSNEASAASEVPVTNDAVPGPTPAQKLDAGYLDDKYDIDALARCDAESDGYLRQIARYDFAWDSDAKGWLGSKFDQYLSYVSAPGVLTLISQKAKLQNGFGAFEHITLYCNYDTQAGQVTSFGVAPPTRYQAGPNSQSPAPTAKTPLPAPIAPAPPPRPTAGSAQQPTMLASTSSEEASAPPGPPLVLVERFDEADSGCARLELSTYCTARDIYARELMAQGFCWHWSDTKRVWARCSQSSDAPPGALSSSDGN